MEMRAFSPRPEKDSFLAKVESICRIRKERGEAHIPLLPKRNKCSSWGQRGSAPPAKNAGNGRIMHFRKVHIVRQEPALREKRKKGGTPDSGGKRKRHY